MRKIPVSPSVGVFLQDGVQEEAHGKTKQESAWLFRLWYTFDHKYPFYSRQNTKRSFYLSFQCHRVRKVFQQLFPFQSDVTSVGVWDQNHMHGSIKRPCL